MKHVFFVHSQITSLITKEIIHAEKLKQKNCVIVTLDIYEKNVIRKYFSAIKIISFPLTKFKESNYDILKRELYLYFWINKKLSFSNYIFYTIHDQVFLSKYISNNFRCKGYYYIEEGLGSFHQVNASQYFIKKRTIYKNLQSFSSFKIPFIGNRKLNISKILPEVTFYETPTVYSQLPKLLGAYKFSEDAFPFIERSILLKSDITSQENLTTLKAPFFIFDNLIASKICSFATLSKVFQNFIDEEKITILNLKFHPLQPKEEIVEWRNIIQKNNIRYSVIDNQIILEEFVGNNEFTFYGFVSSLLFYNVKLSKNKGKSFTYLKKIYEKENLEIPDYYKKTLSLFDKNGISIK